MINKKLTRSPIGIFDSGLGGLTVLKSLEKILPKESFIYLGDTANVPYGNKSTDSIIRYSRKILNFFLLHNTKAVVVACNTASAVAFPVLCDCYDIPLFDVVAPSVEHSNNISKTRKIGVIGTYSTIYSHAYRRSFLDLKSDCTLMEISCPLFVPLIEEGWHDTSIAKKVAQVYLQPIQERGIDTLILGCTHYPIMAQTIQKTIENNVQLIYSGETVGYKLLDYLKINKYENNLDQEDNTQFYVTDFPQKFDELGSRFLGRSLKNIEHVSLD